MRNLALCLALSSALAGCATSDTGGGVPSIDPAAISQIQADAVQVCGFEPTAATVINIIAAIAGAGPVASMVTNAADAICKAVTAKAARPGHKPSYHGVTINGRFVR